MFNCFLKNRLENIFMSLAWMKKIPLNTNFPIIPKIVMIKTNKNP